MQTWQSVAFCTGRPSLLGDLEELVPLPVRAVQQGLLQRLEDANLDLRHPFGPDRLDVRDGLQQELRAVIAHIWGQMFLWLKCPK